MTRQELLLQVETLAKSQGFYCRILEGLLELEESEQDNIARCFDNILDFIMEVEG